MSLNKSYNNSSVISTIRSIELHGRIGYKLISYCEALVYCEWSLLQSNR